MLVSSLHGGAMEFGGSYTCCRPSFCRALLLLQDLYRYGLAGRPNWPSLWNRRVSHYFTDGPPPLAQAGVRRFVPLSFHCALVEFAPAADKIGLRLSAKACFNPTAAPECVFFFCFVLLIA